VEVFVLYLEAGNIFPDKPGDPVFRMVPPIGPDVEDLPSDFVEGRVEGEPDGLDDVPDMDERAVIVLLIDDELPGAQRLQDELVDDEIEPRPRRRPEERCEPEDNRRAAGARRLFDQEFFGGDFRFGIEGLRIKRGVLRDGPAVLRDAVNAVRRGKNEPLRPGLLGELENVTRAVEITGIGGFVAGLGAGRIADDGRQMDDMIDVLKIRPEALFIAHVGLVEGERGVIEISEKGVPAEKKIIEHGDAEAAPEKFSAKDRPDIARAAGYEDVLFFHDKNLLWRSPRRFAPRDDTFFIPGPANTLEDLAKFSPGECAVPSPSGS
jgi:hypothetical protein